MNKTDYLMKMQTLINDVSKFNLLGKDPTKTRETKLQNFLLSLKKKQFFNEQEYKDIYPGGSQPSRLYGLPKMHNIWKDENSNKYEIPPFRPINSSIGSYNYKLAKFLLKMDTPLIPDSYTVKDSFTFVKQIQKTHHEKHFLCSYDVLPLHQHTVR